ncbi:RdgB/HAM1 family non-canonical purine NTP pyrophosphatase [Homoserinibacter sp. GY 40078]|uniref:RdgB/HAM1 family non-canonical purine NTP pyrophosphatase n=1 Tax=Homoserinibacter sp. GY 40078 TaxID=2603275 RepID=UPI0011C8A709|nr:RdgB/HAM1 family non-canonical purine NTP pyrophosphatase [Homoserinibacter sp. GY 40078]TXK17137.1 RdgB/HAM1 family non-canonical purine NTP pyrophosphatase [Homoserinibacter sp. GY 40078]
MTVFVLATHNAHKVEELRRILGERLGPHELVAYDGPEPVEDGDTFEANALIKARAAFAHTGLPAIADDSGIAVRALGGAPGIHSARYAGTRDDADNYRLLLANLQGATDRAAEFVCAAALVDGERELTVRGSWPGDVLDAPRGDHGFGYDPVFRPAGLEISSAELTADQKNATSHRARAFGELVVHIRELYG